MSATATCHCGACTIAVAAAPVEVTDCNCSICRRYGVLWAYYVPAEIDLSGIAATETYLWNGRRTAFHRCVTCGCVTHWSSVDPARQRMGVNARLLPPEILAAARVRHLDGAGTEEYID